MNAALARKGWPAGLVMIFLALIALVFGLRKDTYLLNKNARLIFMRTLKYKEYSLHRGLTYRLQFNRDDYRVTVRSPGPDPSWREVAVFPYQDSIEPEIPGFILTIRRGKLVSYHFEDKRKILGPFVILYFYSPKRPSLRRGIMFSESGEWRTL
jgi:hypothetical protein